MQEEATIYFGVWWALFGYSIFDHVPKIFPLRLRGLFCKSLISEIDFLNKDYYYLRKTKLLIYQIKDKFLS